jgi:hypothetical protein
VGESAIDGSGACRAPRGLWPEVGGDPDMWVPHVSGDERG